MPYALNPIDGARIYYEVEGSGPPLLLHHGMTSGLDAWSLFGYRETLVKHFQCIFMDARGHRMSDSPHDPAAYSQPLVVGDVLAVLDDLGIETVHFWGYSLGGFVGIALLATAAKWLQSLVIGASQPFKSDPEVATQNIATYRQGPEAFIARMEQLNGPLEESNRKRILRNDFDAIAAFMTARRDDPSYDEATLVGALRSTSVPCFMYVGTDDPVYKQVVRASKLNPDIVLKTLDDLNHVQLSWRSDLVLPHVLEFLRQAVQQPEAV